MTFHSWWQQRFLHFILHESFYSMSGWLVCGNGWYYSGFIQLSGPWRKLKTTKKTRHILIITVSSFSVVVCSLWLLERCNFVCCLISMSFISESSAVVSWYCSKYVKNETLVSSALNVNLSSKHEFVGSYKMVQQESWESFCPLWSGVLSLYARICCKIWTGLEVVIVGPDNDSTW